MAPELRQFGEPGPEDFKRHPVWILCHTADYDEPWYEDTDEETLRPWMEDLPATVLRETLLVRARFELFDGSHYPGFVTPLVEGYDTRPDGRRVGEVRHPLSRQQPNGSAAEPVHSGLLQRRAVLRTWCGSAAGKESSSGKCGKVDSPRESRLTTKYPVFYSDSS